MTQAAQQSLLTALGQGAEPYFKDGKFLIKTRGRTGATVARTLVGLDGPTALGQLWSETVDKPLPEQGFDINQPLIRRGLGDYIRDNKGKMALIRRWDANSGQYRYTRRMGIAYEAGQTSQLALALALALAPGKRGRRRRRCCWRSRWRWRQRRRQFGVTFGRVDACPWPWFLRPRFRQPAS